MTYKLFLINGKEFLDQLIDYHFPNTTSGPCLLKMLPHPTRLCTVRMLVDVYGIPQASKMFICITSYCFSTSGLLELVHVPNKKSKAIPVRGGEGPFGCETSRLPHFLDNRLTDSGEVASLMRRPPFNPQKDSWCSFLLGAE
jgi:hypothetical protein